MSDLPSGWEWSTLDEATRIVLGRSPPGTSYNMEGDGVPFFQGKAEFGALTAEVRRWTTQPKKLAGEGDVLLSVRAPVGATNFAPSDCSVGRGLAALRAGDALDQRYVFWFLRRAEGRLAEMGTGKTFTAITGKQLKAFPIPVPPLPEQRRIVAAIEEHFSRLDAAEAAIDSAASRVELMEQSLIDSSVRGAPTMLADILAEPLRNGLSSKANPTGSVRVLTLTAVTESRFENQNTKLIDDPERPIDDLWLEPDDILVQRSNAPELVGTAAIYRGEPRWAIFPDLLTRIRIGESARADYVALALRSSAVRSYFRRAAQGIAGSMPKIGQPIVERTEIPLPSIDEQAEVMWTYEKARAEILRTERDTAIALGRAKTLRHSILTAAFSGQLVPQDPSDEHASVLLQRIAAERAASKPTRKKNATT